MAAVPTRRPPWSLLLLGSVTLLAAGCRWLPPDHSGHDWVARPLRALRHDLVTWSDRLATEGSQSLVDLRARASEVPGSLQQRVSRLDRSVRNLATEVRFEAEVATPRVIDRLATVVDTANRDLYRVARPWNLPIEPFQIEAMVAKTRRAFARLPGRLRLDRSALPDPSDPERQVTVEPAGRRRGWLERVLDRIRL